MEQIIRPAFIHRLKNIISSANDLLILANEKDTEDSCLKEDIFTIKGMVDQMCGSKTIAEVVHHYTNEESKLTYIDAYFVEDDGDTGMTIAVVCQDSGKVISFGPTSHFLNDPLVQEAIQEVLKDLKVKKDEVWPEPSFMIYMEGGVLQSVTSLRGNRNLTYVHIDKDNIQCEEDYAGPFDQYMLHHLKNEPDTFLVKADGTLDNASQYFES